MTNLIKNITGGSGKDQGNCCGVEIKEAASEQEKQTDGCCSPSADDRGAGCC